MSSRPRACGSRRWSPGSRTASWRAGWPGHPAGRRARRHVRSDPRPERRGTSPIWSAYAVALPAHAGRYPALDPSRPSSVKDLVRVVCPLHRRQPLGILAVVGVGGYVRVGEVRVRNRPLPHRWASSHERATGSAASATCSSRPPVGCPEAGQRRLAEALVFVRSRQEQRRGQRRLASQTRRALASSAARSSAPSAASTSSSTSCVAFVARRSRTSPAAVSSRDLAAGPACRGDA